MIKYSFLLEDAVLAKTLKKTVAAKPGFQMGPISKVKLPTLGSVPKKPVIKPNVPSTTRTAVPAAKPQTPAVPVQTPTTPSAPANSNLGTMKLKPIKKPVPATPTAPTPGAMKLKPIKKPVPPTAPAAPAPRTQDQIMSDITNWNKKNAASTTAAPNPAASGKTLAPGITERTYRRPPPSKPVTPITPMTPEAKAAQAQRQQAVKDKMGVGETFKKQKEEEIRLARQKKAEALRAKKARGETMKKIGSTAWSGTKKTLGYTAAGVGGAGILAYNSLQPNSK